jgi:hypothetical protein
LVLWCGIGPTSWSYSTALPRIKTQEYATGMGSPNKCDHLQSCDFEVGFFLLAGHGGGRGGEQIGGRRIWTVAREFFDADQSTTTVVLCRPPIHAYGRPLPISMTRRLLNLRVRPFSDGSTTTFKSPPSQVACSPETKAMADRRFHPAIMVEMTKDPIAFSDLVMWSSVQIFTTNCNFLVY